MLPGAAERALMSTDKAPCPFLLPLPMALAWYRQA